MSRSDFRRIDPKVDFPRLDAEVLELWDRIDAFAESVRMRPADQEYVFYDGPPFATGTPHYGHLLQGVIKDIVPRYWTMRGRRVERRFGWDTHGLPVEMEVQKQLNLGGPRQIAEFGIDRFNEACRAMVEQTTEEWEVVTRRIGRWVDFENDYKTMDLSFMETVWWVFRQLWDRGLVYQAFKVLPYSWGAATPLSNFEVNLGGYREVDDPAITVSLEVVEGSGPLVPGDRLLVWTTTPWTLPGNLAVAVGPDISYVAVAEADQRLWVATARLGALWKNPPAVVATATGSDLFGAGYRPPFDYFGEEGDRGAFRVIGSEEVSTEEGTGLVHMAPAYGEADFLALQAAGLDVLVDPIDVEGNFTGQVPEVAGMNIKAADPVLIKLLEARGILYRSERIRHAYPFCYRTETPLMYKAIPTWFVAVESFRQEMAELNTEVHWVPDYIGSKRFGNWLEGARDWAISRNRYWGSCIPVWECDRCGDRVCVGSLDELEERSGTRPTDLHKHYVDLITWPCVCRQGSGEAAGLGAAVEQDASGGGESDSRGTMRRVPEVLDCWFESGSMPFAQLHYPFENTDRFERNFPADFIAEALDQTRGWFYTLHVLATAIRHRPAFMTCVVTGLILAEDGRKMSKSLKNYPAPSAVLDAFGGDALRAYLIDSPVVRGESLRFSEEGVREVIRSVLLPLWNAFSFFTTYAEADAITASQLAAAPPAAERPELDRWILSVLQSLVAEVNRQMEGSYLYAVIPATLGFIGDLTKWYVRRSRRRFWRVRTEGNDLAGDTDKLAAFATLYEVLTCFAQVLAPILPFVTERIYQELVIRLDPSAAASIHHCDFPIADTGLIDPGLEESMAIVRTVTRLGHALRKQEGIKVRQPLRNVTVVSADGWVRAAVSEHRELIADELNVQQVEVSPDEAAAVQLMVRPDFKVLGPRLGPRVKEIAEALAGLSQADAAHLAHGSGLMVAGVEIAAGDVIVTRTGRPGTVVATEGPVVVVLNSAVDPELAVEGVAREVVSRAQQLRRQAGLAVADRITLRWASDDPQVREAFARHAALIAGELLAGRLVEDRDLTNSENGLAMAVERADG